jgi:hypothetical protein
MPTSDNSVSNGIKPTDPARSNGLNKRRRSALTSTHPSPAHKAARAAAASGVKLRYMQTRLSERGWKSLKLLSIELGKPLQGLVIEALNDMLRKHGRAPDVTGPEPDRE